MEGINVLSLFDGMSCGQIALKKLNIPIKRYYASEIDKEAIKMANYNNPGIYQMGDVTKINAKNGFISNANGISKSSIDLLIAESTCQGFSRSGNLLNFDHPGSKLYFEFLRILREIQSYNTGVKFFLENVKMKKEWEDLISNDLGVKPMLVNSSIKTAQNRERLYWTNIPFIGDLSDTGVILSDIIDVKSERYFVDESLFINQTKCKKYTQYDMNNTGSKSQSQRAYYLDGKIGCLHTKSGTDTKILLNGLPARITRNEAEKLQGVPLNYTTTTTDIKAINIMGNGWTVPVIVEFFKGLI